MPMGEAAAKPTQVNVRAGLGQLTAPLEIGQSQLMPEERMLASSSQLTRSWLLGRAGAAQARPMWAAASCASRSCYRRGNLHDGWTLHADTHTSHGLCLLLAAAHGLS